jgi:hypothetical protein
MAHLVPLEPEGPPQRHAPRPFERREAMFQADFVALSRLPPDAAGCWAVGSSDWRAVMERARRWAGVLVVSALVSGGTAASAAEVPTTDPHGARGWTAYGQGRFTDAFAAYRVAAERDDPVAQFNVSVMLMRGIGTRARPAASIVWLRRSASNGFAPAQEALARMLERGEHVPRALGEATAWYRRAAEQGSRDAQVNLATQYLLGRGVAQSDVAAAGWYERAAAQGDAGACFIVASFYEKGHGVAPDLARALFWYLQAAARGEAGAAAMAKAVAGRLDSL